MLTPYTSNLPYWDQVLDPTNPQSIYVAEGNLELSECGIFTHRIATHASILTPDISTAPYSTASLNSGRSPTPLQ